MFWQIHILLYCIYEGSLSYSLYICVIESFPNKKNKIPSTEDEQRCSSD